MAKPSKSRRGGGSPGRSARPQTKRHYPRTARLNALLQEIVAGVVERIDDDRFGLVTVTGVEVDNDLNVAEVFISTLDDPGTEEDDEAFLDALADYRKPVKAAIASQARIRKTPEVVFSFDPAVRAGARIEEILSSLGPSDDADGQDATELEPDGAANGDENGTD